MVVFAAASGGDVDDARALRLADLVPDDDAVSGNGLGRWRDVNQDRLGIHHPLGSHHIGLVDSLAQFRHILFPLIPLCPNFPIYKNSMRLSRMVFKKF